MSATARRKPDARKVPGPNPKRLARDLQRAVGEIWNRNDLKQAEWMFYWTLRLARKLPVDPEQTNSIELADLLLDVLMLFRDVHGSGFNVIAQVMSGGRPNARRRKRHLGRQPSLSSNPFQRVRAGIKRVERASGKPAMIPAVLELWNSAALSMALIFETASRGNILPTS